MKRALISTALLVLVIVAAACGGGDSASSGPRTIDIVMHDNDFSMPSVSVKHGQAVHFVFHNNGAVVHEAFIGTEAVQVAHETQMTVTTTQPEGPDGVIVQPGQTGTLDHTFAQAGPTVIGCHIPGHYAAGMRIRVTVT